MSSFVRIVIGPGMIGIRISIGFPESFRSFRFSRILAFDAPVFCLCKLESMCFTAGVLSAVYSFREPARCRDRRKLICRTLYTKFGQFFQIFPEASWNDAFRFSEEIRTSSGKMLSSEHRIPGEMSGILSFTEETRAREESSAVREEWLQ